MFYTGIDQHKRNSYITTYGPEGSIVKQERVPNTELGLRQYFAQFQGHHRAVVESTGGWYWLAQVLKELNVELSLAHATRLKAISAAKVKTPFAGDPETGLLERTDGVTVVDAGELGHLYSYVDLADLRAAKKLVDDLEILANGIPDIRERFSLCGTLRPAARQARDGCRVAFFGGDQRNLVLHRAPLGYPNYTRTGICRLTACASAAEAESPIADRVVQLIASVSLMRLILIKASSGAY
jgi:hypothetical protein